ncbi:11889_t:CDS:2, partial [Funneliformis geosporum]
EHKHICSDDLVHYLYRDTVQACQQAFYQKVDGRVLLHVKEMRKVKRLDLLIQYVPFLHKNPHLLIQQQKIWVF